MRIIQLIVVCLFALVAVANCRPRENVDPSVEPRNFDNEFQRIQILFAPPFRSQYILAVTEERLPGVARINADIYDEEQIYRAEQFIRDLPCYKTEVDSISDLRLMIIGGLGSPGEKWRFTNGAYQRPDGTFCGMDDATIERIENALQFRW